MGGGTIPGLKFHDSDYQGEVQLMTLHSHGYSQFIKGLVGALQNHLVGSGVVMAGKKSQPQPDGRRLHASRSALSSWNPGSEEVPFPLAQAAS